MCVVAYLPLERRRRRGRESKFAFRFLHRKISQFYDLQNLPPTRRI